MNSFSPHRILVPVDFTDTSTVALATARRLAEGYDAEMLALFADTFVPPIAYADVPVGWYDENLDELKGAATTRLVSYLREHVGEVAKWEARVVTDTPVHAILATANEWNADLVVMGTHGWSGWRRVLLGSVAESVLHELDVPIVTIRHRDGEPATGINGIKRLLCPVNYSEVAREAIAVAGSIAEAFDGEIYVVHVIEAERTEPHEGDLDALREWIPHEMRHRCLYKELVIHGHAAEMVIDLAAKLESDMIVVGAQHRRFVDTTVIGTTTERILRHAGCPVITVVRKVGSSTIATTEAGKAATA
ncbi:MAG: universal stress protein [Acidobacteria bacterium]|nr:universal stress protein [Acidobacteriota bacterium]